MREGDFFLTLAKTPAYVLDLDQIQSNLQPINELSRSSGCQALYSIKALPLSAVLRAVKPLVSGFSVSSLFEAQLARETLAADQSLHLTTPGLRADEMADHAHLCSHISFNSLSQFERLQPLAQGCSMGMRVNPKLSFADDERYDPCRNASKLGVDWAQLLQSMPASIEGLHCHTVFSRRDCLPLLEIVPQRIEPLLQKYPQIRWLNLGGGYLFHAIDDLQPFIRMIRYLMDQYRLEVFIEPGKSVVGNAGYLVTTVLDRLISDGETVLVLDTTVNHHPEVFEYQAKPTLLQHVAEGAHRAVLVGCSCLAGDVFGDYRFERLPEVGEQLVFSGVGAYSLIKAQRFNGINLPSIYQIENGQISLYKHYSYADYQQQWR